MANELGQKGKKIKVVYAEPADYFPKPLRQKYRFFPHIVRKLLYYET